MAPEGDFLKLAKSLSTDYGIQCLQAAPLWTCKCSEQQYLKLPKMKFNVIANETGASRSFEMPRHAYMKMDPDRPGVAYLLWTPWDCKGMGRKDGETYWILGAQFL